MAINQPNNGSNSSPLCVLLNNSFSDAVADDDGRGRWMTSELQKINSTQTTIYISHHQATLSSSTPLLPHYTTTTDDNPAECHQPPPINDSQLLTSSHDVSIIGTQEVSSINRSIYLLIVRRSTAKPRQEKQRTAAHYCSAF